MKRISVLILIILVVVLVVLGGFLYFSYNSEIKQKDNLSDTIVKNQQIVANNAKAMADKNAEAATFASQLAKAKSDLAALKFPVDAQSIEYDQIFFVLASATNLKVDQVSASGMNAIKEGTSTYQAATFTVYVSGKAPKSVFTTIAQSTEYNASVMNNILAFVDKVATGNDFSTAFIESVNINSPAQLTVDDIKALESVDDVKSPTAVVTVTIWTIKGA